MMMVVVMVFTPPHPTALAHDDGHENHSHETEGDSREHHPQSCTPVQRIVEFRQWSDLVLPHEDDGKVDPEHDRANEHGEDGEDEGDDAHGVGLEEEGRELDYERQSGRDEVEDEQDGESAGDIIDDCGVPGEVRDRIRDGVPEHGPDTFDGVELAVCTYPPDAEMEVGCNGGNGEVRVRRELDAKDVDGLDDRHGEANEEEEDEGGKENGARCEGDPQMPREGAGVPPMLRPASAETGQAGHDARDCSTWSTGVKDGVGGALGGRGAGASWREARSSGDSLVRRLGS